MALLTAMGLEAAARVGRAHGIDVVGVEALEAGSVNSNFRVTAADGRCYFARLYEEQGDDGARAEIELLRGLSAAGVPTAVPISDPDALAHHEGKPVALYPWVEGEILCQARVTEDHAAAVGAALAKVHLASDQAPCEAEGRFRVEDLLGRLDAIEADPAGAAYAADVELIRRKLREHGGARDGSIPRGIIHGDLFRDNVLWDGSRVAALIDFESASRGPFAFDVMVTIEAWCYGDDFDEALVEAMLRGYVNVRSLGASEFAALVTEGAVGALRFATTRITDYSMRALPGEPPKRDYRRFLSRLEGLESGALDGPVARVTSRG